MEGDYEVNRLLPVPLQRVCGSALRGRARPGGFGAHLRAVGGSECECIWDDGWGRLIMYSFCCSEFNCCDKLGISDRFRI